MVLFIIMEDPDVLEGFEADPKRYVASFILTPRRHYFLLDEYQYVRSLERKLELRYGSFKNVKFIVTGSSSWN
ncbi:AAA family ATPase [Candidatus Bathyarchaeota archaeon]|nr:AAA family ATPase [Candidatus Bathyarchaeota archaeon]